MTKSNTIKVRDIEPRRGYKHTALGWIPEDWDVQELIKCADYVDYRGRTPSKTENGRFLVTAKNIRDGFIDYEISKEYVAEKEYEMIMRRGKPLIGDVLITTEAPLGNVAQIDREDVALAQRVIKYRAKKNKIVPGFLKVFLLSPKFQQLLIERSTGSTAKGIKGSVLHRMPISLPSLPEQNSIANLLSTWDKAITNCQLLINNCQLRKKWLMQQLLTGKKRLPGFNDKWKEVSLEEIFERVTRKNEENNKNIVTISAQKGFLRQEDFFNKIVASETLDNYSLIEKGEFCYNKSYCNGYPWGAIKRLKIFEKAVVTTLYICFRLKDPVQHSGDFYEYFFEFNSLDKGLMKIAHEGGRAHGLLNVTPSDFFSLKINIPSLDEQTAIANILQKADEEITIQEQKLVALKQQKKGLMQVLLSGQRRLI